MRDIVTGSELALSVVVMSSAQQGVSTQSQTITEWAITAAQKPFISQSILYLVWSQVDEIVSLSHSTHKLIFSGLTWLLSVLGIHFTTNNRGLSIIFMALSLLM